MDKLKVKKVLLNSEAVDQNCDQSLLSAESKGAESLVKHAAIQQGSAKYLQQQGQTCQQQNCKQVPSSSQHPGQQGQQAPTMDPLYQQGQRYGNGGQYQQVRQEAGDSLNHLS